MTFIPPFSLKIAAYALLLAGAIWIPGCASTNADEGPSLEDARATIRTAVYNHARDPSSTVGAGQKQDHRTEHFVAPDGSPTGDGSIDAPWDLGTALAQPDQIKPGDIVWLRGGRYTGVFNSRLVGNRAAPIVVHKFPGERVVLDSCESKSSSAATLTVHGEYTWLWDFEITNCSTTRQVDEAGPHPAGLNRGIGVDIFGSDIKVINLVIHDTGTGIGSWESAKRAELFGNIIFFNGWDGPDKGHGHGIYIQNQAGTKLISDNIVFNQFGNGIHAYGEEGHVDNMHFVGNISFLNGSLSRHDLLRYNLLLGGGQVANANVIDRNYTYHPTSGKRGGANYLGYHSGCTSLKVTGNYFVGGEVAMRLLKCDDAQLRNNLFLGALSDFSSTDHRSNVYFEGQRPKDTAIIVRPNKWEKGRAHIAIYNWERKDVIDVAIDTIGLNPGDAFTLRNVQDYFGEPVVGIYQPEQPLQVRMKDWTIGQPAGASVPISTFPEFGVFVIAPYHGPAKPAPPTS
jgi:hypothetical protein